MNLALDSALTYWLPIFYHKLYRLHKGKHTIHVTTLLVGGFSLLGMLVYHVVSYDFSYVQYIYIVHKCKNIFTKMLKDVGIEVPKSIETRSKYTMHADKGRG